MNGNIKVIDLLRKQEIRHWTYGQVLSWKSSNPSIVLFHFGPRGLKRLGEWTDQEKSTLRQAIDELKPTDDQTWGLVSLCVEGHERTGQQCKTFAMMSSLFNTGASVESSRASLIERRQIEANECVDALRASVNLDEDDIERQSAALPDFANLKLEVEFSRPKSSSLVITTSDCFHIVVNRKTTSANKCLAVSDSSSTNNHLNTTDKENLASSSQTTTTWDEDDILRPRIRRKSKPKALIDLVDKDGDEKPSTDSEKNRNIRKEEKKIEAAEMDVRSDCAWNQHDNGFTPMDDYHGEPATTQESKADDDGDVPTSKRRRKLVPAESDDEAVSSASSSSDNKEDDPVVELVVDEKDDDDDEIKQVISPLELYLGIKKDLIEHVLDRCLVLVTRNASRKSFKRLNNKYETIYNEAHSILSRLRREYKVDDADDQRFLNGFDDDDKAEIPQGVTEEEYHELCAKNVDEAESLMRELLAQAEPLLLRFKDSEKHIYVENDQQHVSGLDEFDVESSDEDEDDSEANSNDMSDEDDDLLEEGAGEQRGSSRRNRIGLGDTRPRRTSHSLNATKRNPRKPKPIKNQNDGRSPSQQPSSTMGHLSRRPDYIMKDLSDDEEVFEVSIVDDPGDEYRETRLLSEVSYSQISNSKMAGSKSRSSLNMSIAGQSNTWTESFQSSLSTGRPLATVGRSRPFVFSSSSGIVSGSFQGQMRNKSSFEGEGSNPMNSMNAGRANRSMSRDALATTSSSQYPNRDVQGKNELTRSRRNQGYWHRMGVVSEQTALPIGNNYSMPNLRDDLIGRDPIRNRNAALMYHMEEQPSAARFVSNQRQNGDGLDQLMDYLHEEEESESRHALFSSQHQQQQVLSSQSSSSALMALSQSTHSQGRRSVKQTRFLGERYLDLFTKSDSMSLVAASPFMSVNNVQRPGADPVSLVSDFLANPSQQSFECIHEQFAATKELRRSVVGLDRLLELACLPVLEFVFKQPSQSEYVLPKMLVWCIQTRNKRIASFLLFKLAFDLVKQKFSSSDFFCESFTNEQMECFEAMKMCNNEFEWNFWKPFNEAFVLLKTSGANSNGLNWSSLLDELRVMTGSGGWKDEWDSKQMAKSITQNKLSSEKQISNNNIQMNFECCEFVWAMVFQLTHLLQPNQNNLGFVLDVSLGWLPLFTKQVIVEDVETLRQVLVSLKMDLHSYLDLTCQRIQTLLSLSTAASNNSENRMLSASGMVALGLFNASQAMNAISPQNLLDSWLGLLQKEWLGIDNKNARLRLATEIFNRASSSLSSSSSTRAIEQIFVMTSLVGLSEFSTQYDKIAKKVMAIVSGLDLSKIQPNGDDESVEMCMERISTSLCQMASKSPRSCLVSDAYFTGRITDSASVPLTTPSDAMLSIIRSLNSCKPSTNLTKAYKSLFAGFERLCVDDIATRKPQNFVGLAKIIQLVLLETVSKVEFRQQSPDVAIDVLCVVKRLADLKPKPDVDENDESYAEILMFMEADLAEHRARLGDAVRLVMRSIVPRFLRDFLTQSSKQSDDSCGEKIQSVISFAATCVVEYFTRPKDKDVRDAMILALATTIPWPANASSTISDAKRTFLLLSADFISECFRLGLSRQAFTNQQLYDAFWHAFCLTGANVASPEFANKYMMLCSVTSEEGREGESSSMVDFCERRIATLWGLEQRQISNLRLLLVCHKDDDLLVISPRVKQRVDIALASAPPSAVLENRHRLNDLTSLAISCEMPRLCWQLVKCEMKMNHDRSRHQQEWTSIVSQLLAVSILCGLKSVAVDLGLTATQQELAWVRAFVEQKESNGELARITPSVMEDFLNSVSIVD